MGIALGLALAFAAQIAPLAACQPGSAPQHCDGWLSDGHHASAYRLYVPESVAGRPSALWIVLHGSGGDGPRMEAETAGSFNRLAERDQAVVVYPTSRGPYDVWNDGFMMPRDLRIANEAPDHVRFLDALLADLQARFPDAPLLLAGTSNGALMAYRYACERPVDGVGAVLMTMPKALFAQCRPPRRFPVVQILAADDEVVPIGGGLLMGKFGEVASADATAKFWRRRNGCADRSIRNRKVVKGATRWTFYGGCPVAVVSAVTHGGHTWPTGRTSSKAAARQASDLDAAEALWNLLLVHAQRRDGSN